MLEDSGCEGEAIMKRTERCVPDYESMIIGADKELNKAVAFRDAAINYHEGRKARNKMAELIGELVTDCRRIEKRRDEYIALQAQEGGEAG